jgi:hypothetical protein
MSALPNASTVYKFADFRSSGKNEEVGGQAQTRQQSLSIQSFLAKIFLLLFKIPGRKNTTKTKTSMLRKKMAMYEFFWD